VTQVAAVLALIAASNPHAVWVQVLVYVMVATTLISGADYFLGFRSRLEESRKAESQTATGSARRSTSSSRELPRS
jgi:hypothetical protein